MSDFKVYKAGPYYNLGTIYAVITGEKSVNSKDIETEWFYYVTRKHKMAGYKFHYVGPFPTKDFRKYIWDYTKFNLEESIFFDEIVPVLEEIKNYTFYKNVKLLEIKPETLIHLSFEDFKFIDYLKKNTNNKKLKKLVDPLTEKLSIKVIRNKI